MAESGADAVLVTPAHQFPTGAVLAPERRANLVEWALADRAPDGELPAVGVDLDRSQYTDFHGDDRVSPLTSLG